MFHIFALNYVECFSHMEQHSRKKRKREGERWGEKYSGKTKAYFRFIYYPCSNHAYTHNKPPAIQHVILVVRVNLSTWDMFMQMSLHMLTESYSAIVYNYAYVTHMCYHL